MAVEIVVIIVTVVIRAAIIIVGTLVLSYHLLCTKCCWKHKTETDTFPSVTPVTYCPLFSHEEVEAGAFYLVAQSLSAVKRQGQD